MKTLEELCADPKTLPIVQTWAADCVEHVLPVFEAAYPDDDGPRKAIEAVRAAIANPTEESREAADDAVWHPSASASAFEWAARASVAWAARASAATSNETYAAFAIATSAAWAAESAALASLDPDAERAWQRARLAELLEGVE